MKRKLELGDRDWIAGALASLERPFSEACFANLYLFRRVHDYRVAIGDRPYITGRTYDGTACLTPLFSLGALNAAEWSDLLKNGCALYPVSTSELELFPPDLFQFDLREADSDYLYFTSNLAALSGRAARGRRAEAQNFIEMRSPRWSWLDDAATTDALTVLKNWRSDVVQAAWTETDHDACREAIILWRELNLKGLIAYTGATPVGFLLGSQRQDQVIVHFAKGLRAYDGVYPYMFRVLAQQMLGVCTYLNFEQDLGAPRFRQAKRAYAPAQLLHKHRVRLRGVSTP